MLGAAKDISPDCLRLFIKFIRIDVRGFGRGVGIPELRYSYAGGLASIGPIIDVMHRYN